MTVSPAAYRPMGESMSSRQKFVLLNVLMLCMFLGALDQAIVATAIPHILADLGGLSLLSWVITTYILASTVVVSFMGKVSDMFGRKPFILAGIGIFVGASMACGASPSIEFLIIARTVQGIGSGIIFACVFATLGDLYTPIERVKIVGYFISNFTIAALTGPTIGGFLTQGPGWRWCFYVNVPVGVAAIVAIWFLMPSTRRGGRLANIDFIGALLLGVATIAFILGIQWSRLGYILGALICFGLFVWNESRHSQAIIPLFLFRNRLFVTANLIVMTVGGGVFAAVQFMPTFIQTSIGASPVVSGLVSTPQSVGVLVTSILGGQFVGRTGHYKPAVIFGTVLVLSATGALLTMTQRTPPLQIAVYMGALGLGLGCILPMMSTLVQNAVAQEYMGVASSARQFFMSIAQVVGVAALGLVFTTSFVSSFSHLEAGDQGAIPPALYAKLADPTLPLDPENFPKVSAEVRSLPNGPVLLDHALAAGRQGVADATHHVLIGTAILAVILFVLTVTMHEVPLRSTFDATSEDESPEALEARVLEMLPE